jgi:hypothetical protein
MLRYAGIAAPSGYMWKILRHCHPLQRCGGNGITAVKLLYTSTDGKEE